MLENTSDQMPPQEVVNLLRQCQAQQIEVIVDGGWAVDALLGEHTRLHADLDIAMPHSFVPQLRHLLCSLGYADVPRGDTRDCNFVMGDAQGHLVDVHTYTFDEQGNLVFGLPYPPDSLTGRGTILGHPVRCITPDWLVQFHTGYPLDETDYHDVRLLCQRFGIDLPGEFSRFIDAG